MSIFRHYDLDNSELFIFDEFIVNQIREGVNITPKDNETLRFILDEHFKNKSVVYISNRHFSYSVDPLTYLETSKIHNLIAIAIVASKPIPKINARFEKKFYEKPFEIFETLSLAVQWAHLITLTKSI